MTPRADEQNELPASGALQTPESLAGQRIDPPSVVDQLAEYERRQALLDERAEDLDPQSAQGVYLLVAIVIGALTAGALAGAFLLAGFVLNLF